MATEREILGRPFAQTGKFSQARQAQNSSTHAATASSFPDRHGPRGRVPQTWRAPTPGWNRRTHPYDDTGGWEWNMFGDCPTHGARTVKPGERGWEWGMHRWSGSFFFFKEEGQAGGQVGVLTARHGSRSCAEAWRAETFAFGEKMPDKRLLWLGQGNFRLTDPVLNINTRKEQTTQGPTEGREPTGGKWCHRIETVFYG